MDPEDRHLRGNSFFMYRQLFFTCAFHEPPSGIQVSLTHSLTVAIITSRTIVPQDSCMEHERATDTRATGLHLGNSAAKIFDLERF